VKGKLAEKATKAAIAVATAMAASIVMFIFFFLFCFSAPLISSWHLGQFLAKSWNPDARIFGIYPMIVGTFYIAGLATIVGAILGVGLAMFIEFVSGSMFARFLAWLVEFMAGIPTVVYGFSALFLLVPLIRESFRHGSGLCILAASMVLALVILPTVTMITLDRFKAVPGNLIMAAKSLGASSLEVLFYVHLPYAWKGIVSAVILGAGRAVGDTMIALMLAGNAVQVPSSILDSARTLTSHIALITAADYESMSFKVIFVCGLLLFVFSAWNILFLKILGKVKR